MKIPRRLLDINDRVGDVLNYTLYYRGHIDIRVLDVIMALGFVFCVIYYWYRLGPLAALQGGVLYIFIAMCILWFFPSNKEMK